MKSCPTCQRTFDDQTLSYCLDDGTPLVEIYDSQATLIGAPYGRPDTEPTRAASTDPPQRTPQPTLVVNPSYGSYQPQTETPGSSRAKWILLLIGIPVGLGLLVVVAAVAGVFWLAQGPENANRPVANRNTREPSPTPEVRETPEATPTPEAVSVSGVWNGNWENSKGETGRTTITIEEVGDGTITGGEGPDYVMVGGRRNGNTLSWSYIGAGDACFDYVCTFEVDSTGTQGQGTYEVTDSCNDTTFTGTYVDYRKR